MKRACHPLRGRQHPLPRSGCRLLRSGYTQLRNRHGLQRCARLPSPPAVRQQSAKSAKSARRQSAKSARPHRVRQSPPSPPVPVRQVRQVRQNQSAKSARSSSPPSPPARLAIRQVRQQSARGPGGLGNLPVAAVSHRWELLPGFQIRGGLRIVNPVAELHKDLWGMFSTGQVCLKTCKDCMDSIDFSNGA